MFDNFQDPFEVCLTCMMLELYSEHGTTLLATSLACKKYSMFDASYGLSEMVSYLPRYSWRVLVRPFFGN